jgi:RNA polymerase sigma factor (sigma-70 family)
MNNEDFEARLQELRPRLHRYCARMTGSAVDGEDVLQDALVKALRARAEGMAVDNLGGWLLRIAHNTSLDFLRQRARSNVVPLTEDMAGGLAMPETDLLQLGFQAFLQLPELQRCAVILKDVMGHAVEEVASIAGCTPAAAKSALQRGRSALRLLAAAAADARVPLQPEASRERVAHYVRLFQAGDFDAIRDMLAEEVQLELVNRLRLAGRNGVKPYFARYAQETKWRFELGAVDGRMAMLVFDSSGVADKPAHFVLLAWQHGQLSGIRDFLFAPYVLEGAAWLRMQGPVAGARRPVKNLI